MQHATAEQSRNYNLRRREWKHTLGDFVLLRQHHLSKAVEEFAAKLAPRVVPDLLGDDHAQQRYDDANSTLFGFGPGLGPSTLEMLARFTKFEATALERTQVGYIDSV
ncbi:hypothetical protein ACLKA6_001775 [Drosophila palustris]